MKATATTFSSSILAKIGKILVVGIFIFILILVGWEAKVISSTTGHGSVGIVTRAMADPVTPQSPRPWMELSKGFYCNPDDIWMILFVKQKDGSVVGEIEMPGQNAQAHSLFPPDSKPDADTLRKIIAKSPGKWVRASVNSLRPEVEENYVNLDKVTAVQFETTPSPLFPDANPTPCVFLFSGNFDLCLVVRDKQPDVYAEIQRLVGAR